MKETFFFSYFMAFSKQFNLPCKNVGTKIFIMFASSKHYVVGVDHNDKSENPKEQSQENEMIGQY